MSWMKSPRLSFHYLDDFDIRERDAAHASRRRQDLQPFLNGEDD
ncbi:hypothetical protein ACHMW4_19330 [Mesorhizobium sp. UC22_110]